MNKQRTKDGGRGIEWTDYTWNPIAGCKHACRWEMPDGTVAECYAKTVAERVAQSAFPQGFEHHYNHAHRLNEPLRIKTPARIFVGSMNDLFGHWVSDEEIKAVLEICRQAHWHTFQLLTKNPHRLPIFKAHFPPNVWVGFSAPPTFMGGSRLSLKKQTAMLYFGLEALAEIKVSVKWMSVEPLSFDIAPYLANAGLRWAIIGAASNGRQLFQPEPAWVENLLTTLDQQGVAVFFKGNLAWEPRREDFPALEVINK